MLAMAALKRAGALAPGCYRLWRWSVGDREVASIGVRAEDGAVRLIYRAGIGAEQQAMDERVAIEWRACRFGGSRPYFACPRCWRAALNVHLAGARFVCRACARLSYGSQRECARDRHLRAANKLRRRLGGEAGTAYEIAARPRGMWRRTYDRLVDQIVMHETVACEELAGWMVRIDRRRVSRAPRGFWA